MSTSVTSKYARIGGAQNDSNIGELRKLVLPQVPIFHSQAAVSPGVASATLTPAQCLSDLIYETATGAINYTLPTAALLVAAIPEPRVGLTWRVLICNNTANNASGAGITILTGDGCTLVTASNLGAAILGGVALGGCIGWLRFRLTNVTAATEAYTCHFLVDQVQAT